MTTSDSGPTSAGDDQPTGGDDTAAFQRYYLDQQANTPDRGLLYKLFVGWWRKS